MNNISNSLERSDAFPGPTPVEVQRSQLRGDILIVDANNGSDLKVSCHSAISLELYKHFRTIGLLATPPTAHVPPYDVMIVRAPAKQASAELLAFVMTLPVAALQKAVEHLPNYI